MQPYNQYLEEMDQLHGIQITMKQIGNYRDKYDMAYAINFMKDDMLLSDDNNDPIMLKSKIFYPPNEKRQIKFNNHQLRIPVNPEKMRLQYYNNLHKLYIQFKFAVRLDEENNQELFGWYAHPLYNAVDKLFSTGYFDVEVFALPIVEEDFYDQVFERIPIKF